MPETSGQFKKVRPAKTQPVVRAERTGHIQALMAQEGQACEPKGSENW